MGNSATGASRLPPHGLDSIAQGARVVDIFHHTISVSAKTTWVFLEAQLDDGTIGVGEASAFEDEDIAGVIGWLRQEMARTQPGLIAPTLALLTNVPGWAGRVVASALEQAILDAFAKRLGLKLTSLLGGPYSEIISTYANINRGIEDRSPEGFGARARDVVREEGYQAIKIAPFDGYRPLGEASVLPVAVARVMSVREAVGDDVAILIDCHDRLDPQAIHRLLPELAIAKPFWIEDAFDLPRYGAAEGRRLRDAANTLGILTAGGERLTSVSEAVRLIQTRSLDAILPDLRLTGIVEGLAILRLAAASGVGASLHNPAGPILDAVSRQVAASVPNFMILERQVRESPLYSALADEGLTLNDGRIGIGSLAGHGLTLDHATLRRWQDP